MKTAHDPAYPAPDGNKTRFIGITKREYFASVAMQSLINYYGVDDQGYKNDQIEPLAKKSILIADALLKQLES